MLKIKHLGGDFPGGTVAKNLLSNAGDAGSIASQGTRIPHAVGCLSPRATTREKAACYNEEPEPRRKIPEASAKTPRAATKTQRSQKIDK